MNIKWIDAEMAQKRVRDVERERDELRAKNEWAIEALKALQKVTGSVRHRRADSGRLVRQWLSVRLPSGAAGCSGPGSR
jgi:hypothetical protein